LNAIERTYPAPLRAIGVAVDWTIVLMGAVVILLVFSNIVLHAFGRDIAWTTEVSELLMVWMTFLGGTAAGRRGEHVAITELIDRLGSGARYVVDILIQFVIVAVLGLLIWYGSGLVESAWNDHSPVLDWPMSFVYLAVPVSSVATLLFVLYDLVLIVRGESRAERISE